MAIFNSYLDITRGYFEFRRCSSRDCKHLQGSSLGWFRCPDRWGNASPWRRIRGFSCRQNTTVMLFFLRLCLILQNNGFPYFPIFSHIFLTGLRNRFFFVLVSVSQAMSPAPTSCLAAGLRGPTATIFDRYSFIAPGSLLVFNDSITRQSWVLTEKNKRKTQSQCVCEFRCALCRVSHGFLQSVWWTFLQVALENLTDINFEFRW